MSRKGEEMKHIAILTGGPSAERSISLKSADLVVKYLDPLKYSHRLIVVNEKQWLHEESGEAVDLNDFSLTVGGVKEWFDFVFIMIHGTPAEDGKIQGYFEFLGIPHSTCHTLVASLTFNKQMCKDFLRTHGIPLAKSLVIRKGEEVPNNTVENLGLPLFVKPNSNGSSYGITKVKTAATLTGAVEEAFQYDTEVIIEYFLEGTEYGCGVVREGTQIHAFPVTEIIPKAEFFTFEAKYEGASEEITPARLSNEMMKKCQDLSSKIYHVLGCRGMVRFDYILVDDEFYLLEANTIPGLSEASIIPQQAKAYGWTIGHLLDVVIENCSE